MFDLKVYGAHRVPAEGGVLIISNHQSYLDPVLLGVRLQRPLSYLAKSELFGNWAFAWLIRSLGAFPVKQGAGDVGAMKETIARLQEGRALNIFPEGSRTETGELLPIEKGVGLVIRKARVPVVPAVIDGSFSAWPKGHKLFRPFPIRILYGYPLDLSSMDRDQMIETIRRTFETMFAELRGGRVPLDHRDK
jgi:1-acyl-sn-glycerol-3-phosphate acyltransferase